MLLSKRVRAHVHGNRRNRGIQVQTLTRGLTIIEDGNNQHHEWWKIKLPYEGEQHKTKLSKQRLKGSA